jgi:hypothetical protein
VFANMIPHAPEEIRADTVAVREDLEKLQQNVGSSAADPLGGAASSLATGLASDSAFEAVGNYLQAHCPLSSAVARRYVASAGTATTTSSSSSSSTSTTSEATPAIGSTVVSEPYEGRLSVATTSSGFALIDSLLNTDGGQEKDESKVTTFTASGRRLAEIGSGALTGECGADYVRVPGVGPVVLTELITTHPAEGIKPLTSSIALDAWNGETGTRLWSLTIVADRTEPLSCEPSEAKLESFANTYDGRWGVYAPGGEADLLIDLASGAVRRGAHVDGVLGDYTVIDPAPEEASGNHAGYTITAPATGAVLGHLNGVEVGTGLELATNWPVPTQNPNENSGPVAGLSTDGQRLISVPSENHEQVIAYSLPSGRAIWHGPSQASVWGDGGGVVIISEPEAHQLVALNDKTGHREWSIPIQEEPQRPCAITSSQLLLAVHEQLAVIDLKTGKQVSYSADSEGQCPDVIPGGLEIEPTTEAPGEGRELVLKQILTP